MSDLLSIGASGVKAYQTALTTTSENIANVGTDGYSRRTTDLREITASNSYRTRSALSGQGVSVDGVSRQVDQFRIAEVRVATADLSRTQAGITSLQRIDNALSDYKLGDRLTQFFNSATAVAADPSATAPRATMLEAAESVADAFAGSSRLLDAAAADIDDQAGLATAKLNEAAQALAKINSSLSRTAADNSGHAQLLDQRDRILEEMSELTHVSISLDTFGRATVKAGSADRPLVEGDHAGTVNFSRNEEGVLQFSLTFQGERSYLEPNGGALSGMQDGAQRIAATSQKLDQLAQAFVEGVNDVQAPGEDLSGGEGKPLFAISDGAGTVSRALDDPADIAAATPGAGARDNGNLEKLAELRTTGGFENGITAIVTDNATVLSGRETLVDAQEAILEKAVSLRNSASAVNLDEEAVDLLRFQQAYQASSRVIQVARETLQSLLNMG
ncbi:flagellar hook-associated protein FlgK [Stakelama saccharophila]|uniref:Flagellar hook-associated protein 1 n=1 Tax=Stakelama saccharophila TaxID=3075605 RepID=A0ABZ0B8R7_9SPHN|nr:flagellar hook-associated protein FlgK [Stakelama sp. W311]WNO53670.1 flagellar hook-associated protein FlgK [Stakelama sp. W311]